MSMQRTLKQSQIDALQSFLTAFQSDTCADIAQSLSCIECEALAVLLEAFDKGKTATALREAHCLGDSEVEGDDPAHLALKARLEAAFGT